MMGWVFSKHCSVAVELSLRNGSFLDWFMVLSNGVFIDRKNKDAREAMGGAADAVFGVKTCCR